MTSEEPKKDRQDPPLQTQVQNRQRRFEIYRSAVSCFCRDVLAALGKEGWSLTVVFVGADKMKEMNRRYRDRNEPTDILSFSYGEEMVDGVPFLGEIVIAPAVAWDQARRFGNLPDREIRVLLVHGILHLLGYDHEADGGEMLRLQASLIRKLESSDTALLAKSRNNT